MRVGALGMWVATWIAGCCCFGSDAFLGPPRPNDTEARELARRYIEQHLAELVRDTSAAANAGVDAGPPSRCRPVDDAVLDAASYSFTVGTVGSEPATRVAVRLIACIVEVAVVLLLVGGVWTAVSATARSHDGEILEIGRAIAFSESLPEPTPHHHHHHHH